MSNNDSLSLLFGAPELTLALRDESGRPLGESACPERLRPGVEIVHKRCFYSDIRRHQKKPMNVSPLRQILSDWDEVLGAFLAIRKHFLARQQRKHPTITDLFFICTAIDQLPNYLRKRATRQQMLPAFVGSLYKVNRGALATFGWLLFSPDPDKTVVETDVLLKAFRAKIIGRAEVCPAPPELLSELAGLFCEGRVLAKSRPKTVARLLPDLEDLFNFSMASILASLIREILRLRSKQALSRLRSQTKRSPTLHDLGKEIDNQLARYADVNPKKISGLRRKIRKHLIAPVFGGSHARAKRAHMLASRLLDAPGRERNQRRSALAAGLAEWLETEKRFIETYRWFANNFKVSKATEVEPEAAQILSSVLEISPRQYFESALRRTAQSPRSARTRCAPSDADLELSTLDPGHVPGIP